MSVGRVRVKKRLKVRQIMKVLIGMLYYVIIKQIIIGTTASAEAEKNELHVRTELMATNTFFSPSSAFNRFSVNSVGFCGLKL